jgi:hypothetical protein
MPILRRKAKIIIIVEKCHETQQRTMLTLKKTIKLALRKPLKHTSKIMNIVLSKSLNQTFKKTIKIALKEPLKQT